ncbi:MAG TPA: hypothetical protein VF460_01345, partial [Burkholderiales bacterium]
RSHASVAYKSLKSLSCCAANCCADRSNRVSGDDRREQAGPGMLKTTNLLISNDFTAAFVAY